MTLRRLAYQKGRLLLSTPRASIPLALLSSLLLSVPATADEAPASEAAGQPPFEPEESLVEYAAVGSKVAQSTQLTPASVVVITGEQLWRAGYTSVGEALGSIPGVFVSDDLQNVQVALRGVFGGARAGSRSIRVLIDGVPVTFMQSGINLLGPELLPLSAIERIELLKGPASALYGTGALTGAINIVTRRPAYEGETTFGVDGRVRGGLGGQRGGGGELSATVTGQKASLLVGLSGDFLDRSGLKMATGPFSAARADQVSQNDTSTPLSGILRGEASLLGGRISALAVGQLSSRAAEFHDLTQFSHNTRIALFNFTGAAQYERQFASGLGLMARFGANYGAPAPGDQYDLGTATNFFLRRRASSRSLNATIEGRYEPEAGGAFVLGAEWTGEEEQLPTWIEVNKGNGVTSARAVPPVKGISNVAGYFTAQYPVLSWLSLAAGARYDFNTAVGSMFGARAGAVFSIADRASIKALFGRSHRAPSPEQLYGVPATLLDVCGPEGAAATSCSTQMRLTPQYLTGGELVADVFVARWLNLSANGYVNRLENNLAYLTRGTSLVPTAYDATQYGGEGQARLSVPVTEKVSLDASAGVAIQTTLTDQSIVAGFLQKDVPDNEAVPTTMALATAGFRFLPLKLSALVEYRFIGPRTPSQSNLRVAGTADMDRPNYTLTPYHLLNATLSIAPIQFAAGREVGFQLRVTNLLNARWSEIGFNGVDVPNLGTTAWLSVRLTI